MRVFRHLFAQVAHIEARIDELFLNVIEYDFKTIHHDMFKTQMSLLRMAVNRIDTAENLQAAQEAIDEMSVLIAASEKTGREQVAAKGLEWKTL